MESTNLVLRFLLEIVALIVLGLLGWNLGEGMLGIVLAAVIPIGAAILWGVFAVPNDPSRSGNAPVPIPGLLRLILEFFIFASAIWSFVYLNLSIYALIFAVLLLVHYITSYRRVRWLLLR